MILSLSHIEKRFGPTIALAGVNLDLQAGEVHALIGENGAGKSTLMNILAGAIRPETRVADLSVAARQIVEICRSIAARARILLMDEPTSSLQRADVERLFGLIRKLRSEGLSVIYISHFLEEVREIADRFTVLRDGQSVATGEIASVTDDDLITQMVGRPVQNLFPRRGRPSQEADSLLEVNELAAPPGLRRASFAIRRGEIFGVAGLMGSGRTQLVRAIFGLDEVRSGTIILKGRALSARGGQPAIRLFQGLGYLSEDRKGEGLGVTLSVADNITVTRFSSCSRWGWLNLSRQQQQAERLIKALGVKARNVAQSVKTLSGGNQQKVALARLLHQDADVLLLDEPTRGIDIGSKVQVYDTIARCAAAGKAVLMVSSYLPELFGMCDRLAVMSPDDYR